MNEDKNLRKNILITGATGNIGMATIEGLIRFGFTEVVNVIAAVRNVEREQAKFENWGDKIYFRPFDFEDARTFETALDGIDAVFLLRPPSIADVTGVFEPLIQQIKAVGIEEIVFLSVQGVEQSSVIPHHKIEKVIEKVAIPHVFLRPSYFMQNLTTTLGDDLRKKRQVILPAGNAIFNWVDVKDIGEVAAKVLMRFEDFENQKIVITGKENLDFQTVINRVNAVLNINIIYKSVNLIRYYFLKKKENVPQGMIIVMILLHFLPRFQKAPNISNEVERILKREPTSLEAFIERTSEAFFS